MAMCPPGRESSPDRGPAGALILDFLASWTLRGKFLWVKPQSKGIWVSSQKLQIDKETKHSECKLVEITDSRSRYKTTLDVRMMRYKKKNSSNI